MKINDYKIIRGSFFNSYKSFIDFIMLTNADEKMYNILVLRNPINENITNVNVTIRNSNNNTSEYYNEFTCNMILNNDDANSLINDIREDFKENHYISYSSVNRMLSIQTLQNTKFSLNIKLLNNSEYEEAIIFNSKINQDNSRHKVLTKV